MPGHRRTVAEVNPTHDPGGELLSRYIGGLA